MIINNKKNLQIGWESAGAQIKKMRLPKLPRRSQATIRRPVTWISFIPRHICPARLFFAIEKRDDCIRTAGSRTGTSFRTRSSMAGSTARHRHPDYSPGRIPGMHPFHLPDRTWVSASSHWVWECPRPASGPRPHVSGWLASDHGAVPRFRLRQWW